MFIAIVYGMHSRPPAYIFFNSLLGARSSITGAGTGRLDSLHSHTLTELRALRKRTPSFEM